MSPLPKRCLGILLIWTATVASGSERANRGTVHSQPSFLLRNGQIEMAVTELGGHLAPVTFYRDSDRPIQPYYISPWQNEPRSKLPVPVLGPLRGDFFCLPFGGNTEEVAGEKHPPHGEVAGSRWRFVNQTRRGAVTQLTLAIDTKLRKGRVTQELSLVEGENVVYQRHVVEGFAGRTPLGHHATLALPEKEGAVRIATSPLRFGMTCPTLFSDPQQREYQSLLPGARWTRLSQVPAAWKNAPDADLSRLPARRGYADLVQLVNESGGPAWVTATHADAGFTWFSLKDPAVLNSTVIWIENHGRHGPPWNGRNNCVGLEDVTAHFADGLAASIRDNALTAEGVPTALTLRPDQPTAIHYIQGVVKTPSSFVEVRTVEFSPGKVTFVSTTGERVTAPVHHEFLKTGKL